MTIRIDNGLILFGILAVATFTGCHPQGSANKTDDQAIRSYFAQGVVEKIDPDRRLVTIHHQAIPGYMMEMTMDFPVNDPDELKGLSPGANITFTLNVDPEHAWVNHIRCIGYSESNDTNTMSMSNDLVPKLKPGDALPDTELMAEDGRMVHFSDFHGKVLAFTFFFTRCPLPNYCPLMNRNFAQTRKLLLSTPNAPTNWQLLSISFDSKFDTSENLSSYAGFYRNNDADRWLFASASPASLAQLAPPLGLMVMGQDGNITHNLRTVVLDPQGRLYRQFNDNLWTPRQLADAILEAAREPGSK